MIKMLKKKIFEKNQLSSKKKNNCEKKKYIELPFFSLN